MVDLHVGGDGLIADGDGDVAALGRDDRAPLLAPRGGGGLDERWLGFGGLRLALPDAWYANYFTAFFGFLPFDFYSTDYFALLPWLFLFWAGYYLHKAVGRRRMEPLRRPVCPVLGWMGRHSLLLYLLHQPVIYGVLSAAAVLFA